MPDKQKIKAGRKAVDAYRTAHTTLYKKKWHKGIPDEHTPLLEQMLKELSKQGFDSLAGFFDASQKLNMRELGFKDKKDFRDKATKADREALNEMWK